MVDNRECFGLGRGLNDRDSINSSMGSNNSRTHILGYPGLRTIDYYSSSVGHSVYRPNLIFSGEISNGFENFEEWAIDLDKLIMGEQFAEGGFGKLYMGTYNGQNVAVKILERPLNDVEKARALEIQFQREVKMLATLDHPNILRFIGACRKPTVWYIVTEYIRGGTVREFLTKRQGRAMPLKLIVNQALDVARGMQYIHDLGYIHRDIKSENLLIGGDRSIRIADFGLARMEMNAEEMTPEAGSYRWMAPEMIQRRPYTQKVDVYSFGIVLWELVTGMLPFQSMTATQAAFRVVHGDLRPTIPNDCLPNLKDIMTRCWHGDPNVRPTFTEVVRMLEEAENEIMTTVRKARFRCCVAPMTID